MTSAGSQTPAADAPLLTTVDGGRPIAVSPHLLASEAAIDIMGAGGSAVDGAIALNAVLGVVLPDTCGLGGDLFALVHSGSDTTPAALNASGRAGSRADAAELRAAGLDHIPPRSAWTVTVPGCVDGWAALHGKFGALSLSEVLRPAIDLAGEGFPVSTELSESLERNQQLVGRQPAAAPLYPDGEAPEPGKAVKRPRLAETLAAIATDGRDAFYAGPPGKAMQGVSPITAEDLEREQAEWVDPVGTSVFGIEGWTIPPNSQGYLTLAAAWIVEALEPPRDAEDPDYVHAVIEAYRAAAAERDDLVSDPTTAPLHPNDLLDPERLRNLRAGIDPDHAAVRKPPSASPGGTAYMCTRDRTGMGVSLIQSNFEGIGSGLTAGDTGVFLHNRGAGFTLAPGHPNEMLPGRRPLHTLSPTLWTRRNRLLMLLGTRGGHYQPQLLAQIVTHRWWAGADVATAQAMPRWVIQAGNGTGTHHVSVEAGHRPATLAGLREKGHDVDETYGLQSGWGPVSMIEVSDNTATGAADPRVSTAAAVSG